MLLRVHVMYVYTKRSYYIHVHLQVYMYVSAIIMGAVPGYVSTQLVRFLCFSSLFSEVFR